MISFSSFFISRYSKTAMTKYFNFYVATICLYIVNDKVQSKPNWIFFINKTMWSNQNNFKTFLDVEFWRSKHKILRACLACYLVTFLSNANIKIKQHSSQSHNFMLLEDCSKKLKLKLAVMLRFRTWSMMPAKLCLNDCCWCNWQFEWSDCCLLLFCCLFADFWHFTATVYIIPPNWEFLS